MISPTDGAGGARPSAADELRRLRNLVGKDVVATLGHSAEQGLLGTMAVPEQIEHALGFVRSAEEALGRSPSTAADLGSGGGIPGLILYCCWPNARVALIDGSRRRTGFLESEVRGWSNPPQVVEGRAEELGHDQAMREQFEVVAARSFGPPPVTVECGGPLLRRGGVLVVSEPPGPADPDRWPEDGLAGVGLARHSRFRFDDRFSYQVLIKSGLTPDRYPRRVGIPAKRPLF